MSLSCSTQWLSGNTQNSLFSFDLNYKKKSCAQAAKGPEKGHAGDPVRKGAELVQPWEKKI